MAILEITAYERDAALAACQCWAPQDDAPWPYCDATDADYAEMESAADDGEVYRLAYDAHFHIAVEADLVDRWVLQEFQWPAEIAATHQINAFEVYG